MTFLQETREKEPPKRGVILVKKLEGDLYKGSPLYLDVTLREPKFDYQFGLTKDQAIELVKKLNRELKKDGRRK